MVDDPRPVRQPDLRPLTAVLVDGIGWRDTIRVPAAIAAIVFLAMAAAGRGGSKHGQPQVRRTTVPTRCGMRGDCLVFGGGSWRR